MDEVEGSEDYQARKRDELSLLREFIGEPLPTVWPRSTAELWREKRRLRARLLSRAAETSADWTETNPGRQRRVPVGPGALRWEYQRYDLEWRQKPFHHVAYPLARLPPPLSIGLLVGSGMAAVSTALGALDALATPGQRLLVPDDAYFETLFYLHRHLDHFAIEMQHQAALGDDAVLLLDSFSVADRAAGLHAQSFARLSAVVLDTTCYDGAAPEIDALVAKCARDGVLCVLLRSHLKLDQLALEYARLGSIVLLLPRPARPQAIARLKRLRDKMRARAAVHGAHFTPWSRLPLLDDPRFAARFIALNQQRNRRLRRNNLDAAAELELRLADSLTRVTGYHHGCFFVLRTMLDTIWDTTRYGEELARRLTAAGVEARVAPSFGYDFVSITRVSGVENTTSALRVAVSDLPRDQLARLIDVIADYVGPLSVY